jgi:hypothetical protein
MGPSFTKLYFLIDKRIDFLETELFRKIDRFCRSRKQNAPWHQCIAEFLLDGIPSIAFEINRHIAANDHIKRPIVRVFQKIVLLKMNSPCDLWFDLKLVLLFLIKKTGTFFR